MATSKRQKKQDITRAITDKVAKAKSVVVTDYRGLNTAQLLELRQKLAEVQAEYTVTKNTLLARALREQGYNVDTEISTGPTATLFAYGDEVAPLRTLTTFARLTKLPVMKAGFLGKQSLSGAQVEALAKLPSKEVLIGTLVGTLNAPISGLVNALQGNIRNLVYVLQAIQAKEKASSN